MLGFALLGIVAVTVAAQCAFGFAASSRNQRRSRPPASTPNSIVRVLRSDAEVSEAVDRAIEFERAVAESVERRIAGYHAARQTAPLDSVPARFKATSQPSRAPGDQASA